MVAWNGDEALGEGGRICRESWEGMDCGALISGYG